MVLLTEIYRLHEYAGLNKKDFSLREVIINPSHVFMIREDEKMAEKFEHGYLPDGLDERQKFTLIHMDRGHSGIDVTVVGDVELIREKLFNSKKLLKG